MNQIGKVTTSRMNVIKLKIESIVSTIVHGLILI